MARGSEPLNPVISDRLCSTGSTGERCAMMKASVMPVTITKTNWPKRFAAYFRNAFMGHLGAVPKPVLALVLKLVLGSVGIGFYAHDHVAQVRPVRSGGRIGIFHGRIAGPVGGVEPRGV